MTGIYTVTWTHRIDPRMGYMIPPRSVTCLDEDTANEVHDGIQALGHTDLCITIYASTDPVVDVA